jgi:pilus assembly protein TadC
MIGEPLQVIAALLAAVSAAAAVAMVSPPPARLSRRVRPYALATRALFAAGSDRAGGSVGRLFAPMVTSLADRVGRLIEGSSEAAVALRLRQSGLYDQVPEGERLSAYRLRQLATLAGWGGLGTAVAVSLRLPAARALAVLVLSLVVGATRQRGRIDRVIEDRRNRMRIEIYTVNQLLALRVRTGGGVVHAVQQLVHRGRGEAIGELAEALRLHRAGMRATDAFMRIAGLTPEPACARTYSLLAAAEERGADLATALLDLAEDVREARREAIRRAATKRRAAMLVPIIGVLAPVMLLFVGAPLPQLVLNWR